MPSPVMINDLIFSFFSSANPFDNTLRKTDTLFDQIHFTQEEEEEMHIAWR
jgi:hypothetical protein